MKEKNFMKKVRVVFERPSFEFFSKILEFTNLKELVLIGVDLPHNFIVQVLEMWSLETLFVVKCFVRRNKAMVAKCRLKFLGTNNFALAESVIGADRGSLKMLDLKGGWGNIKTPACRESCSSLQVLAIDYISEATKNWILSLPKLCELQLDLKCWREMKACKIGAKLVPMDFEDWVRGGYDKYYGPAQITFFEPALVSFSLSHEPALKMLAESASTKGRNKACIFRSDLPLHPFPLSDIKRCKSGSEVLVEVCSLGDFDLAKNLVEHFSLLVPIQALLAAIKNNNFPLANFLLQCARKQNGKDSFSELGMQELRVEMAEKSEISEPKGFLRFLSSIFNFIFHF